MILLNKPYVSDFLKQTIAAADIKAFDYEQLLTRFEKPLELRKINYGEYPVFGFLFAETRSGNMAELEYILQSDLKEFILT